MNVSAYSAAINAGNATVNAGALFNASNGLPAPTGSVGVHFYNGANVLIPPSTSAGTTFDANPATWQNLTLSVIAIPVNTQFIRLELAYSTASMVSPNGSSLPTFVDDAVLQLNIVPEPSSLALAGLALGGAWWMRRRRR